MPEVLIVDDNIQIRQYMRACLTSLGFTSISEAVNGREALEISKNKLPDIITLDWNMPEMDGLKYLIALRKLPGGNKPKVIFCSTESRTARINEVMEAGADEYITKPFDVNILKNKLVSLGLV